LCFRAINNTFNIVSKKFNQAVKEGKTFPPEEMDPYPMNSNLPTSTPLLDKEEAHKCAFNCTKCGKTNV
jgi:hypothetical protein